MKILLIGLSGSGKTTVSKLLAKKYNLEIIEADDEVKKYNNSVWPSDDDTISRIFGKTNKIVVNKDNLIYIISWMDKKTIKDFYDKGFEIFEMHADFTELIKRKNGIGKLATVSGKPFETTYIGYFNSIASDEMKEFYKLSIDTTKVNPEELLTLIAKNV